MPRGIIRGTLEGKKQIFCGFSGGIPVRLSRGILGQIRDGRDKLLELLLEVARDGKKISEPFKRS